MFTPASDEILVEADVRYAGNAQIGIVVQLAESLGVFGSLRAGVRNLSLCGAVRLEARLATTDGVGDSFSPATGVSVCFLRDPDVDFDLFGGPLATFLHLIELDKTLRQLISDTVIRGMVAPEKIFIVGEDVSADAAVAADAETTADATDTGDAAAAAHGDITDAGDTTNDVKMPPPLPPLPPHFQGMLRIHVVEANDLEKSDRFSESDPYVKLQLNAKSRRTNVMTNNSNPKWNEVFDFSVDEVRGNNNNDDVGGRKLRVDVFDKDNMKPDFLGGCNVDMEELARSGSVGQWFHLENKEGQKGVGRIHLRGTWRSPQPPQRASTRTVGLI